MEEIDAFLAPPVPSARPGLPEALGVPVARLPRVLVRDVREELPRAVPDDHTSELLTGLVPRPEDLARTRCRRCLQGHDDEAHDAPEDAVPFLQAERDLPDRPAARGFAREDDTGRVDHEEGHDPADEEEWVQPDRVEPAVEVESRDEEDGEAEQE